MIGVCIEFNDLQRKTKIQFCSRIVFPILEYRVDRIVGQK